MKLIAAIDAKRGIGRGNELLFDIPEDMKRFKELTTGNTVIMGRKTLESLPGGRPLPNRRNIVLTRQEAYDGRGAEVFHCTEELIAALADIDGEKFVIGGAQIYKRLLPLCEKAYITYIDADGNADVFLPEFGELWERTAASEWKEYNGIRYRFEEYDRQAVYPSCLAVK
jgi:dihydrofolate reductase